MPCLWGKIGDAYVPAVTYCHLQWQTDQTTRDLGNYVNGFWRQNDEVDRLPFSAPSFRERLAGA